MRKSNYAKNAISMGNFQPKLIQNLSVNRNRFGLPDTLITKVRYYEEVDLTSTAGSTATYAFRMNSLFDPNFTGAGHQPYYFDQLSPLYSRYNVLGSKLRVQFSAASDSATSGPWSVGVVGDGNGTISSVETTNRETNTSDSKILMPRTGSNNLATCYCTFAPMRDLGVDPYDDTNGADVASNPTGVYFAVLFVSDVGASTSVVRAYVNIEFTVAFDRLVNQTGS